MTYWFDDHMWNYKRARRVVLKGCCAVLAVEEAAVGVHGLDQVLCLKPSLCIVQSAFLVFRIYFEHFLALEGALQLFSIDVGDASWSARILEKIAPVGVAVLVDALDAQNVYSAVVKRSEKLLRTAAARAGGGWWWRTLVCIASLCGVGEELLVFGSEQRLELSLEQEVRTAKHGAGVEVAADGIEFGREHQAAEAVVEHLLAEASQTHRVAAEQQDAMRVLTGKAHSVPFQALVLVPTLKGPKLRLVETSLILRLLPKTLKMLLILLHWGHGWLGLHV